ncbi:MAG: HAMP domain-containing histidine kinase [Lachnospiraceae bacterium]|nr:HAMP domain-containing histidine kinase [Lachnospiraceae bacterium]
MKKALIAYTVIMIAAAALMIAGVRNYSFDMGNAATYSDEELNIYKSIRDNLSKALEDGRTEALKWMCIFWAVLFVGGYLLFYVFYRKQIKPIRELEAFATEISKGNLDIALPIRHGDGNGSFVESFDMMREELKSAREREMAAEKAKREMVAELSHDLKTPVATIKATCEVLEMTYKKKVGEIQAGTDKGEEGRPEAVRAGLHEAENTLEKIGYISSKIETINKLVENVLHANIDDLEEVKVNVTECESGRIKGFFEGLKDYGNIIFDNEIPECLVYMDLLRMEQVVDNVVGNSFKYAGTDIHVSFALSNIEAEGKAERFVEITVKDSGPGVPEDELPLIVGKYYRGRSAANKPGYGLGLYLVKTYMEKQGGGMECFNDNGFTVKLYVRKV